jgi:hypothetical protein
MQVLGSRLVSCGSAQVNQVLIRWSELASWEDYESLKQKFPSTPAWGQATSEGEGSVSASAPVAATVPDAAVMNDSAHALAGATSQETECENRWAGMGFDY